MSPVPLPPDITCIASAPRSSLVSVRRAAIPKFTSSIGFFDFFAAKPKFTYKRNRYNINGLFTLPDTDFQPDGYIALYRNCSLCMDSNSDSAAGTFTITLDPSYNEIRKCERNCSLWNRDIEFQLRGLG